MPIIHGAEGFGCRSPPRLEISPTMAAVWRGKGREGGWLDEEITNPGTGV